jgi:hypothetical protein
VNGVCTMQAKWHPFVVLCNRHAIIMLSVVFSIVCHGATCLMTMYKNHSSFGCHVADSDMTSRLMVSSGNREGCGLPGLAHKKIMLDSDDVVHCHCCCCIA